MSCHFVKRIRRISLCEEIFRSSFEAKLELLDCDFYNVITDLASSTITAKNLKNFIITIPFAICQAKENSCWSVKLSASSSSSSSIFSVDINMAATSLFPCDVDGIGNKSMFSWSRKFLLFFCVNRKGKTEVVLADFCSSCNYVPALVTFYSI